jgi:hypothetical protein
MANRIDRKNQNELDKLTRQDANALKYFSPLPTHAPKTNFDDLVVTLAGAYENKRARQVVEWEKLRRSSLSV